LSLHLLKLAANHTSCTF